VSVAIAAACARRHGLLALRRRRLQSRRVSHARRTRGVPRPMFDRHRSVPHGTSGHVSSAHLVAHLGAHRRDRDQAGGKRDQRPDAEPGGCRPRSAPVSRPIRRRATTAAFLPDHCELPLPGYRRATKVARILHQVQRIMFPPDRWSTITYFAKSMSMIVQLAWSRDVVNARTAPHFGTATGFSRSSRRTAGSSDPIANGPNTL